MKCQKCDCEAMFHITEMIDGEQRELHLCTRHAQAYLHPITPKYSVEPDEFFANEEDDETSLKDQTDCLVADDFQTCPYCGVSFQDFRKSGRLGCRYDYEIFRERLEPLVLAIHGATEHVGKRPNGLCASSANRGATLVRLRSDLNDAIQVEDYERASVLRDKIAMLEQEATGAASESATPVGRGKSGAVSSR